ncbi:MAG: hypothetical protein ACRDCE_07265, partial [Cetobacterium sp.]|uniref:hypothetical protein n=1 Tax=Cetobacterium sp. TaxID=2071632 RepID=UPI003EE5DC00
MNKKTEILNKWTPILESEKAPAITSMTRKDIVAAILENQERDIANDHEGVYSDSFVVSQLKHLGGEINEAVVTGDHSYDATKIASGENSGAAVGVGPAVMGMVRRAIPNMIAFDICGVQPMSQPTGQIFTLRALYGGDFNTGKEAFHPLAGPDAGFSGLTGKLENAKPNMTLTAYTDVGTGASVADTVYTWTFADGKKIYGMATDTNVKVGNGTAEEKDAEIRGFLEKGNFVEIAEGMATSWAELMEGFDGQGNNPWNEMSFRIDKQTVEAKSRQLKAQYSIELAQDLKAVHGISADGELSSILATEIMLEINREILLWVNATAQNGKTGWTNTHGGQAGVFNFADPLD